MNDNKNLDKRYQTMIVIWMASFSSIGFFYLYAFVIDEKPKSAYSADPLTVGLFVVAFAVAVASLIIRKMLTSRAELKQDPSLVQTAMIAGCALCEIIAFLGVLEAVVYANAIGHLLFVLAAVVMLLHFPRRKSLLAASYR